MAESEIDVFDVMQRLAYQAGSVRQASLDGPKGLDKGLRGDGLFGALALLGARTDFRIASDGPAHAEDRSSADLLRRLNSILPHTPVLDSYTAARVDYLLVTQAQDDVADSEGSRRRETLTALAARAGVPGHLPLLETVAGVANARSISLDDVLVVGHQHLLGSNVSLLRKLLELGCHPDRMLVVGKGYSTSAAAMLALELEGVQVESGLASLPSRTLRERAGGYPADYRTGYRAHLESEVDGFVRRAMSAGRDVPRRLLILDDGGLLITSCARLLNSRSSERRFAHLRVGAVEQTTAGRRLIVNEFPHLPRKFPVVDVARTGLKLKHEGEQVGESVVRELRAGLNLCRQASFSVTGLSGGRVAVIGYGAVGSWVAASLRLRAEGERPAEVVVYDAEPVRRSMATAAGYLTVDSLDSALVGTDVVVGCTGVPLPIDAEMLSQPIVFASASSWDTEFSGLLRRGGLRSDARSSRVTSGDADFDVAHELVHGSSRRGVDYVVLNSGFPVNFTGGVDPIEPSSIQVTRALMLGGALTLLGQGEIETRPSTSLIRLPKSLEEAIASML
jgi:hypothetical protein